MDNNKIPTNLDINTSTTMPTKGKFSSHESELAALERQAKQKAAASALRKQKAAEKKKKEEDERINLAKYIDKEAKEKEANEKKALEDEETAINNAQKNLTKDIIELNDMTDTDPLDVEEVNMDLFNDDGVEDDDPSSPAYKKTRGQVSSLKSKNRYGPTSTPAARKVVKKTATLGKNTFFADIGITLTTEDKATEWKAKIPLILTNAQLIDEKAGFVELRPTDETKPRIITDKNDFPTNHTLLGIFVCTTGTNIFAPPKKWNNDDEDSKQKKKHRDDDEDGIPPKTVYATIRLTSDKDPLWLLNNIRTEFEAHGGTKLVVKEVQAAESKEVAVIYNISTLTSAATIERGFQQALAEAMVQMTLKEAVFLSDEEEEALRKEAPQIKLKAKITKVFGQDTKQLDKLPWSIKKNRMAFHVETDVEVEEKFKNLVQFAKHAGIFKNGLGKRVHISEMLTKTSTGVEVKRMIAVTSAHANYQISMTADAVMGIRDLEAGVKMSPVSTSITSIRQVMLRCVKMMDGHSLLAEVHQQFALGAVDVVYPNCDEAERMILNMKKNVAAFLYFLLEDTIPVDVLKALLSEACEPNLVMEIDDCTWDKNTNELMTKEDIINKNDQQDYTTASWYSNTFDLSEMKVGKKADMPSQLLFDLDETKSLQTIHNRHKTKPASVGFENDSDQDDEASAASKEVSTPPRRSIITPQGQPNVGGDGLRPADRG